MIETPYENIAESLENLSKANRKFNKALAKMLLSMPIPMNYETWSFLHKIADGDVE